MPEHSGTFTRPLGWDYQPLGEVADVSISNVDKKSRPREPKIRLCNYLDVYQNGYVDDSLPYMAATASRAEIQKFGLKPGDVIITKDSETPHDIGIATFVKDVGSGVVCGYHLALIRPRDGARGGFLAKQIGTERIRRYFAKEANGTTRYGLSTASVVGTPIWLPGESEQRRIAEILDTLDEAIRKTEQVIAKLQQMKQGLLHDLLTRGIDENGELRDPERHPEQFKDSPLGRIPREWDVRSLVEVAEVRSGIAKNSNKAVSNPVMVHYLRVANVQDGFLDLAEMSRIRISREDIARYQVLPGDVLMNEGGDLDKLGRGAIWRGQHSPCVHQNHVFVVRCAPNISPDFLNMWTGSSLARRYFLVAGKQTTNLASINKTALGQLPVVVPNVIEQEAIVDKLRLLELRDDAEAHESDKLRTLKHGLMDDLLTGRVRVSVPKEAAA